MERRKSRSRERRRAVWRDHLLQWRVGGRRSELHFRRQPAGNSGTGVFGAQIVQGNMFEHMPNAVSVSDPAADVSGNQIFNLTVRSIRWPPGRDSGFRRREDL